MVKFQLEHIISLKHGGKTALENLAYACPICNSGKGADIGTVLEDEDTFVQFSTRANTIGSSILNFKAA